MTTTTETHDCGGTILIGGPADRKHLYCNSCGAYTCDVDGELPTGTDAAANLAAWDDGEEHSPMAPDADTRTDAERWLAEHGFDDGSCWHNGDGVDLLDELGGSEAVPDRHWLHDGTEGPETATSVAAYVWPDGSAVVLTEAWWDVADLVGTCATGRAETDEVMDALAAELAPEGYRISRGSYSGTADDRIDQWYVDEADSDLLDRRGRGHWTLAEAVEAAREWAEDEAALGAWEAES